MEERSSTRRCERENDLIAFLYGEVNEREARDFERHLRTCSECESEFSAFKPIRQSMIAWRNEALGRETAPFEVHASVPRKQSAMTAFREFFNLSPLWLKATVAFASIAFCVFSSLALARFFNHSDTGVVSNNTKLYTEEELKRKIDEAVQAKVHELASQEIESPPSKTATVNDDSKIVQTMVRPSRRLSVPSYAKSANRPLTRMEREQLAADLRLISPKDEISLELLSDRINQE